MIHPRIQVSLITKQSELEEVEVGELEEWMMKTHPGRVQMFE